MFKISVVLCLLTVSFALRIGHKLSSSAQIDTAYAFAQRCSQFSTTCLTQQNPCPQYKCAKEPEWLGLQVKRLNFGADGNLCGRARNSMFRHYDSQEVQRFIQNHSNRYGGLNIYVFVSWEDAHSGKIFSC